jgi:hypothetical protein
MSRLRRSALVSLLFLTVLGGCLGALPGGETSPTPESGAVPSPDSTPASTGTPDGGSATTAGSGGVGADVDFESYVFDHAGIETPVIEGGVSYPRDGAHVRTNYATLVTSRDGIDRSSLREVDRGAASFVENTSFDRSYLVAIQEFPASSHPDYRVERVREAGDELRLSINDSSPGGTSDLTVETILVRVAGDPPERAVVTTEDGSSFSTSTGIVTRAPPPTPTPDEVELPYRSANDSENVADPRGVRIHNAGTHTNGYRITVTYAEVPACRESTPPCEEPTRVVTVLDERGKLPPGASRTVEDVAARTGGYSLTAEAEVPAGDGSRRTVTTEFDWRIDGTGGDAVVTVTDDGVRVTRDASGES